MVNVILTDSATGKTANIGDEGVLNVVVHPHPPIGETLTGLPYSSYLKDSNDSNDMIVNGSSATPIDFDILALNDYDFYIKSIAIQISDPGARMDRFGALTALTNGCDFFYKSNETGELIIEENIQTNLDFYGMATGGKGFGSAANSFLIDLSGGGEDTYLPEIDFFKRYGLQYGVRIRKQSDDTITMRIKDNLAGLSVFNIKAYGIII